MKVRAKFRNSVVEVKAMAKHDMVTYNQAETKTGDRENANFITHITGTVSGETVFDMSTSQFLSKNPIFKFAYKGKKGDELLMTWVDRKGNTDSGDTKVR